MVIGFLGKGGSGKSTLAARTARHLHQSGKTVLAIDGDHNVDLLYNLGVHTPIPYLGAAMSNLRAQVGLAEGEHYQELFLHGRPLPEFRLTPPDPFTREFSAEVEQGLRVMASGPHTDEVLHGEHCSHSLSTPLKVYLPCLALKEHECVVVDEKAGVDSVTTGIPTGCTFVCVIANPLEHSIRVANQIAAMLDFYEIPYEFVGNNTRTEEDRHRLEHALARTPIAMFSHRADLWSTVPEETVQLERIIAHAQSVPDVRTERTRKKFSRNVEFQHR